MKNGIIPCLWFDGTAKAAADFYCSVFKDSRIIEENPMVVTVELDGFKLMGLNGGPKYTINPSISFFVNCSTTEEAKAKWDALSDGGTVLMPLDKYEWSEKYGWCQDKFGVNWQVMTGEIGGQKIVPSLMFAGDKAGKAADAMEFYSTVFDDSKIVEINRYLLDENDVEGYVKHGQFLLNGQYFASMDSSMAPFLFDPGVSLVVQCESQEEIDRFWNALTAEGEESMCGWLIDKYGVSWQIVPAMLGELMSGAENAERVTQAFMAMKKLDIEALKNA